MTREEIEDRGCRRVRTVRDVTTSDQWQDGDPSSHPPGAVFVLDTATGSRQEVREDFCHHAGAGTRRLIEAHPD